MSLNKLLCITTILFLISCKPDRKPAAETNPLLKRASIPEIEQDIKSHIEQVTKASNGYFPVSDRGQDFQMKLVRVHTEYLSSLGPGKNFACVDLVDVSGDVYDVDFNDFEDIEFDIYVDFYICYDDFNLFNTEIYNFHPLINNNNAAILGISSLQNGTFLIDLSFDHRLTSGKEVAILGHTVAASRI